MFRFLVLINLCVFSFVSAAFAVEDPLISTTAKQAIVIDYETGAVLYEKNADEHMPTSSMSKVMTMYVVFDALKRGDIKLDDTFLVSEKAWRKGGSKMFVEVDRRVKVEDLIRGVIIQSGNDATIVLAEGLAGSEEAFVHMLNAKARDLGMTNSQFKNASGWPDPEHYSSARDLAKMAHSLVHEFPEYYDYYSETEFTFSDISQKNRNPLLYREIGADGIKTGHTEDGGYGLIGSGVYQGRRVIIVVNGLADNQARAEESAKLLEWGLKQFENKRLFSKGEIIEHAAVVMGQKKSLPVTAQNDVVITIPKISLNDFEVSAVFKEPVVAPVKQGQLVGSLSIKVPYVGTESFDLRAADNVAELGFVAKTFEKAKLFVMEKL